MVFGFGKIMFESMTFRKTKVQLGNFCFGIIQLQGKAIKQKQMYLERKLDIFNSCAILSLFEKNV